MQQLMIIGNLTKDPEIRTTSNGKDVCSFTVAVNRRPSAQQKQNNEDPGADYFRISAWEERGRVCQKYLTKGNKVFVSGTVSVRVYTNSKGEPAGQMEVKADQIEFLSPKGEKKIDPQTGYEQVNPDDLPY